MSSNNKLQWDDAYSLDIDSIDNQHKNLFLLVNRLYELDESQDTKEDLRKILYEFNDYINIHFAAEEKYMSYINYPELEQQKEMHESFRKLLSDIIHTPAKLDIIKTKMRVFAKRALIDHISNEDVKIKLFKEKKHLLQ
ncbi:hemerythrin family protein [Candidatus Sulfurimonas marisnigri]|uniref:Hemerythrin family protein n=1 Tax=Candidatus Sulfurimonas marisnigri TaxID=2740405 RepID=A0A7S7M1Q4_9BACT|nr:hemerythrin family protein [Candidatus Sulfurimonas marisnigri]QOY55486.1 hemerythrin family protein [Candidatus Sulfurimonas marisnigri]